MNSDHGFDGVHFWVRVPSDRPDAERKARLRAISDEFVRDISGMTRTEAERHLDNEAVRLNKILKALKDDHDRADRLISERAYELTSSDSYSEDDEEEAGAYWSGEVVENSRYAYLTDEKEQARQQHSRVVEHISVLESLQKHVASHGVPISGSPYVLNETELGHLKDAVQVVQTRKAENNPIGREDDWRDAFENIHEGSNSANAIKASLHRAVKRLLKIKHLPDHYKGFTGGFQRMLNDFCGGTLVDNEGKTPQDKERQI